MSSVSGRSDLKMNRRILAGVLAVSFALPIPGVSAGSGLNITGATDIQSSFGRTLVKKGLASVKDSLEIARYA